MNEKKLMFREGARMARKRRADGFTPRVMVKSNVLTENFERVMEFSFVAKIELKTNMSETKRPSKRSARLMETQLKQQRQYFFLLHGKINNGDAVLLEVLPKEVLYSVFSYLTTNDLSKLAITSLGFRKLVEEYMDTQMGLTHLLPASSIQWDNFPLLLNQFTRIGIFLKRCTCLYPTRTRLKLIRALVLRLENRFLQVAAPKQSQAMLSLYAELFNTVTAGWEDIECESALKETECWYDIPKKLMELMLSPAGSLPQYEPHLREFYRSLWLDSCPSIEDKVLRLQWILRKSNSLEHQAYLILLLFAPTSTRDHSGKVCWSDLPHATTFGCRAVKELADVLSCMTLKTSDESICPLQVYYHVTSIPDPWSTKARANLMVNMSRDLATNIIRHDMAEQSIGYACELLVQMAILSYQNTESPVETVRFMKYLCDEIDDFVAKRRLMRGFWRNLVSRTSARITLPRAQMEVQLAIEVVIEMADLFGCNFYGIRDVEGESDDESVDIEE